jgi:ABC-type cobalt transport system substrate-binding protein
MREEDVLYNDNVRSIIRGRLQITGADTDELNDAPLQKKCPLSRFNILLTRRNMYVIGAVLLLMIIVIAAVTSTRSGGVQGEPVSTEGFRFTNTGTYEPSYEPTYEPTPETTTYEPTYETTNDAGW